MKSLFERKHYVHSPLKMFVEALFPHLQRVQILLLLLRFRCRCSQINMLPLTKKCGNDTSCCTSLQLRCHSSIRSLNLTVGCFSALSGKMFLVIHLVCPFSMKWRVQSALNSRQSPHNYSSSHALPELLVLGVLCNSE